MGIRIDSQAMAKGLQTMLLVECEALTDWLWSQVQGKAPPEVRRDMIHKEVKAMAGYVMGTVSAGGMMALVTEWGSGSLADTSNPAWDEYTRSKYWNPSRDPGKHTIRGRPEGEYVDLDGETHYSSGRWEGRNLEWKYPPIEPQHWMREIVTLSRPYIYKRLALAAKTFPFHRYIHSDGR
jgi:hypothetical protein